MKKFKLHLEYQNQKETIFIMDEDRELQYKGYDRSNPGDYWTTIQLPYRGYYHDWNQEYNVYAEYWNVNTHGRIVTQTVDTATLAGGLNVVMPNNFHVDMDALREREDRLRREQLEAVNEMERRLAQRQREQARLERERQEQRPWNRFRNWINERR